MKKDSSREGSDDVQELFTALAEDRVPDAANLAQRIVESSATPELAVLRVAGSAVGGDPLGGAWQVFDEMVRAIGDIAAKAPMADESLWRAIAAVFSDGGVGIAADVMEGVADGLAAEEVSSPGEVADS